MTQKTVQSAPTVDVDPVEHEPALRNRAGRRPLGGWLLYAVSGVVTSALTFPILQLWQADLRIPFNYTGDAVGVASQVKTVLETGWYEYQNALGAPAGQRMHDFPAADNFGQMVFKFLGMFTGNYAVVLNVYYLLTFPLAALAALWFLRRVGVSRAFAVVLSILYAFVPYHFQRNEAHLFLGAYYPVPLALGVVYFALRGERVWVRRGTGPRWLSWFTGRGAFTFLALALIATASSYYGVFTLFLLAGAGVVAFVKDRNWARLSGVVGAAITVGVTLFVNLLPDILYERALPPNTVALSRSVGDSEVWALKFVELILPSDQHRIGLLRSLRRFYDNNFPIPSESPVLGMVGAAGFVISFVFVLYLVAGPSRPHLKLFETERGQRLRDLSVLTFACFLIGMVGGVGSVVSLFLTDSIRGYNRISIFISLLAFGIVGLVIDAAIPVIVKWRWLRTLPAGLLPVATLALLLSGGLLDQASPLYLPDYKATAAEYHQDDVYVHELENLLPRNSMVFQLPFIPYPESPPVNGVLVQDQLRMYLHSTTLRWSAGGIKGRPSTDWPLTVTPLPAPKMVDALRARGFSGISVDRAAYPDHAAKLEASLQPLLGPAAVQSPGGRYAFYLLASRT